MALSLRFYVEISILNFLRVFGDAYFFLLYELFMKVYKKVDERVFYDIIKVSNDTFVQGER